MGFHVTECENFTDIVSDATLPLTLKETVLRNDVVSKKNIWNIIGAFSAEAIKRFLPFPTTYLWQMIQYKVNENPDAFY